MSGGNHDNAAIGEALKRWRVQKGLSQTSVAKQMQHAGLRWYQTTVARVEKGERPLLIREAEPLARILGHEASDLSAVLAGTDAPWADRDILDRLRGASFDSVTAEDLRDAVAEIERLRAIVQNPLAYGSYVLLPDTSEHPRTVGDLRKAVDGMPDEAQMFVNVSGHAEDYAVDEVWASEQIPDGEPWPTDKRTVGLEIHLGLFPERPDSTYETEDS